jgi:poly-gamma-glutamate synthesis protein (capsule biosynthesis protein)
MANPFVYEEQEGNVELAFTGDCLVSRRLSAHREPRFQELTSILQGADVSFTNGETLFHDYEGSPVPESGPFGTYVACDPRVIEDLRSLGIDMVATANNHCVDYGETGVMANLANLDAYGMHHAGTGRTLSEAVAPSYLDSPKGSVALIAVTLTMPPANHRAGDPRGRTKGRPGANVIRHTVTHVVPPAVMATLRDMGQGLGLGRQFRDAGDQVNLFGERFVVGDQYEKSSAANDFDVNLNLKSVSDARRLADWVVVSVHCHEGGLSRDDPADFARKFALDCVDAGADVVFGHGPHRDRGIELYKGKPILHSLGNFVLHNDLIKWQPADLFQRFELPPDATTADIYDYRSSTRSSPDPLEFQSALVLVRFEGWQLKGIELLPLDLGASTGRRSQRGRPVLAEGEVAGDVLQRIQALSKNFGTEMTISNGRGLVDVGIEGQHRKP